MGAIQIIVVQSCRRVELGPGSKKAIAALSMEGPVSKKASGVDRLNGCFVWNSTCFRLFCCSRIQISRFEHHLGKCLVPFDSFVYKAVTESSLVQ